MRLSPRLALAAQFCSGTQRLIEIGCDHARLSAFIVLEGAEGALACDLRDCPLSRAKRTIGACGLEQKVELRLSDGLQSILPSEGDTIAICGMGGELIAAILRAAPWALSGTHRLVLQPQSKAEVLRAFLAENGCGITREALARDAGKLYCVLEARGGEGVSGEEYMHLLTEQMKNDALFADFLRGQINKYRKIIAGRASAGLDCSREMKILKMLEKNQNAT